MVRARVGVRRTPTLTLTLTLTLTPTRQALLVGFHLQGIAIFGIEPLFYPIHADLPLTV